MPTSVQLSRPTDFAKIQKFVAKVSSNCFGQIRKVEKPLKKK